MKYEPVILRFLLGACQLIRRFVCKGFGAAVIVLQVRGGHHTKFRRSGYTKVSGNFCAPDPLFWCSDL